MSNVFEKFQEYALTNQQAMKIVGGIDPKTKIEPVKPAKPIEDTGADGDAKAGDFVFSVF